MVAVAAATADVVGLIEVEVVLGGVFAEDVVVDVEVVDGLDKMIGVEVPERMTVVAGVSTVVLGTS